MRVGKGNRYYRKSDVDLLINDQVALAQKWAKNNNAYEPEAQFFCKTRDIFQARLEHFQSNLIKNLNPDLASLISAVAGEIGNNSFDHNLGNWPDILGIYFAYSLSTKRVVLADRGLGVFSTLQRTLPKLSDHSEALKIAFTKTVSGRAPESRGNGLKFVRNVVTKNPLNLFFQTGNAVLNLKTDDTDIDINIAKESIRGCLAVIEY